MTRLEAGYIYLDGRLRDDRALELDETGRISAVVPRTADPPADVMHLALFPGFVNAHSHAFQWGLRGVVQRDEEDGDFFSWRDRMFALVLELDEARMAALARRAFAAMRAAGYTTVGEFHYVHHQPGGEPYDVPTRMAEVVIAAAREVGLRCCLLHAAYLRPSGVDREVAPGQSRFLDPDVDAWLRRHQQLARTIDDMGDPHVSLGCAPHSVRTVDADSLATIAGATRSSKQPLHLHINEQRREIDESLAEHGLRPFAVAEKAGAIEARSTLIHMTHGTAGEVVRTAALGSGICFCPTTERDLGDGIGPSRASLEAGVDLSIGSDSHVQIDPFEELRLLEGHERLRREARLVLGKGSAPSLSARLWSIGSAGGARSLRVDSGAIEVGRWADLVAIDLTDPDLDGVPAELVPDVALFGASPRAVTATFVAGRRRPDGALGSWDP